MLFQWDENLVVNEKYHAPTFDCATSRIPRRFRKHHVIWQVHRSHAKANVLAGGVLYDLPENWRPRTVIVHLPFSSLDMSTKGMMTVRMGAPFGQAICEWEEVVANQGEMQV